MFVNIYARESRISRNECVLILRWSMRIFLMRDISVQPRQFVERSTDNKISWKRKNYRGNVVVH